MHRLTDNHQYLGWVSSLFTNNYVRTYTQWPLKKQKEYRQDSNLIFHNYKLLLYQTDYRGSPTHGHCRPCIMGLVIMPLQYDTQVILPYVL